MGLRLGAFGVIFDADDRVLLCHRRDMDAWNLPGGRVENGETPWDAAVREVREEVCLDVSVTRLTGVYWKREANDLVFNFECVRIAGQPGLSDEADDVRYFAISEIPGNTSPLQVERINDAVTRRPKPFLKTQGEPLGPPYRLGVADIVGVAERATLQLLAIGVSRQEIARRLVISRRTLDVAISRLLRMFDCDTEHDLTTTWLRETA